MTNIEWTHFPGYTGRTWNLAIDAASAKMGAASSGADNTGKPLTTFAFEERAMAAHTDTVCYVELQDFPGYRVGDDGSVWTRWAYNGHQPRRLGGEWRRMTPSGRVGGYVGVSLFRAGKPYRKLVHRLVLESFVSHAPAGQQCCHNDGDPQNNRLSNLRWDTATANHADRAAHGTLCRGERSGLAKLTEQQVRAIKSRLHNGAKCRTLAAEYGVSPSTISMIKSGKNWGWLHV